MTRITTLLLIILMSMQMLAETSDSILERANLAFSLHEYKIALGCFEELKTMESTPIGNNNIDLDNKIMLCRKILSNISYAEAMVHYRERNFDETLKLLSAKYVMKTPEIQGLIKQCNQIKKELQSQKPNVTYIAIESWLRTPFAIWFGTRDPYLCSALRYRQPLMAYWDKVSNKGGYKSIYSSKVFPAIYDIVTPFHEGLALVKKGSKWHYIDTTNNIVIRDIVPARIRVNLFLRKYDMEPGFYVSLNDYFEFYWQNISDFELKMSMVKIPKDTSFDYSYFSDGVAWVSRYHGGKPGYYLITKQGVLVLDGTDYIAISPFHNGLCPVTNAYYWKCGMIDKHGKQIMPFEFESLSKYGCGLVVGRRTKNPKSSPHVHEGKGEYGIFNLENQDVVKPKYDNFGYGFNENLVPVEENGKWGYADTIGTIVIPCVFDKAYDFGGIVDGFAHVKVNGKDGFVDHFGFSTLDFLLYDSLQHKPLRERINLEIHKTSPIVVTDVQFGYIDAYGKKHIGDTLPGSQIDYLFPIVYYHGLIDGEGEFTVKWFDKDYTSEGRYSCKINYIGGDGHLRLKGWGKSARGNSWAAGKHYFELWLNGRLLAEQAVMIAE